MKFTLSLVEDNPLLARELSELISSAPDMECLDVFPSAEAAIKGLAKRAPEILLVDLRLPGLSGIELIGQVTAALPNVQCVVLTMYKESEMIFDALKAGACGYLLKRTPPEEILQAIRQVHGGGSVITPQIARQVLDVFSDIMRKSPEALPKREHQLSEREYTVLKHLVNGLPRKQIADELQLNTHTLDYTIRTIYKKLHVNCLAAAVSVAVKDRIVKPGD